ncbi:MAG: hypothetical protein A2452_07130 [Candidatus Firestonebacteria bacterium RIFOXYC2_FULL_39_67]|nr:MAG: hypothetical protein A2536_04790 [Candidatus Firestonebacteria bacterium RIFOXYD2_FULL_39_29]OGF51950.1 MAG: hypothetical protein A2497_06945 [Candidatus Firestonebacteria bacterium RifOxyC12_full_39_7]OGF54831.1 MAG: hypothetical protein A2452_07130 [Candidatus Firestonebacteria bacterium RIFOXYC2_FULL_39_67]
MSLTAVFLAAALTLSGIEYRQNTEGIILPPLTGRITGELEAKTGIRIRFIIDKNIEFSPGYFKEALKTGNPDNDIIIFVDVKKNKLYKYQGKNTSGIISPDKLKYIIENEISGTNPLFFNERMDSLAAVFASLVSEKKNIHLKSLEGIYVKPVNSFLYRITAAPPFSFAVKAFYYNIFLFISIFPVISWFIFVKAVEILFGETAAEQGSKVWKVFLFATFCVIITRVLLDYNRLIGTISAVLVLFMPFVAICTAIFKDEIRNFTFKFFGWED